MIKIEEKNKISIITIILLFLVVISIIWICFTLGEIEHESIKNDTVEIFNKEPNKKDDIIDNGEVIVFEKKDEDIIVKPVTKEESNEITKNVSKKNANQNKSQTASSSKNSVKSDNKVANLSIEQTPSKEPDKTEDSNPPKEPDKIDEVKPPKEPGKNEEQTPPKEPDEPDEPDPPKPLDPPKPPEPPDEPDPPVIDRTGTYWAEDKDIVWEDKCSLGIFKNPKYNMRNIIAPGSTSSYVFYVCNKMGFDLNYIINFSEENDMNVNMMYKLRRGDEYIAGDEDTWVYYDSLHIDYNIANEGKDKYILEWKWVDSDNDTEIGINHAGEAYKLNIDICATQISGFEEEITDENDQNGDDDNSENDSENSNNNTGDNSDNSDNNTGDNSEASDNSSKSSSDNNSKN